jgi:hypothetical protein
MYRVTRRMRAALAAPTPFTMLPVDLDDDGHRHGQHELLPNYAGHIVKPFEAEIVRLESAWLVHFPV